MGTGIVPGQMLVPDGCRGTCSPESARTHMVTGRVPGNILAPEWCPGTYWHQNGARAHLGIGRVPGHR